MKVIIPDGVFSVSDDEEFNENRKGSIPDGYDSEIHDQSTFREFESEVDETEDPEIQRMIEAGIEACPKLRVRFADDDGGSTDRRCALIEPTTQVVDPRAMHLEQSNVEVRIALLRELGVYDSILQAMPPSPSCILLTSEEDPAVMSMEDFVETDMLLTLGSGCCDHIVDMADAPGYACVLHPSAGSLRG